LKVTETQLKLTAAWYCKWLALASQFSNMKTILNAQYIGAEISFLMPQTLKLIISYMVMIFLFISFKIMRQVLQGGLAGEETQILEFNHRTSKKSTV
jgi:hypothetical protein